MTWRFQRNDDFKLVMSFLLIVLFIHLELYLTTTEQAGKLESHGKDISRRSQFKGSFSVAFFAHPDETSNSA